MGFGDGQHHERKDRKIPENLGETWEKEKVQLQTSLTTSKTSGGAEAQKKYMSGENLSRSEAMLAKCADCCGWYADGKSDCKVPLCALYPWMPYRRSS